MSSRDDNDPLAAPEAAELRDLARAEADTAADSTDAGFEALQRRIAADQSTAGRAKALSTRARVALGSVGVITIAAVAGLAMPRADLAGCAASKIMLTLGTTTGLVAIAIALGLRPLHRPPLPSWALPGLVAATAAGLGVCYFVCPVAIATSTGVGTAAGCAMLGTVAALPLLGLLFVLDRGSSPGGLALAAAAGAAANTTLLLHCGNANFEHMLAGHATVVLIVTAGYLLCSRALAFARRT
jgi:hypothetical protein